MAQHSTTTSATNSSHQVQAQTQAQAQAHTQTQTRGEDGAGRERLKRHRDEVAGNMRIPDKWGQEQMMKEWIEFSSFDALLGSHHMIIAARDALIADARKAKSPRLRVQSSY